MLTVKAGLRWFCALLCIYPLLAQLKAELLVQGLGSVFPSCQRIALCRICCSFQRKFRKWSICWGRLWRSRSFEFRVFWFLQRVNAFSLNIFLNGHLLFLLIFDSLMLLTQKLAVICSFGGSICLSLFCRLCKLRASKLTGLTRPLP